MRDPFVVHVLRSRSTLGALRLLVVFVFGPPFGGVLLVLLPGLLSANPIADPANWPLYLVVFGGIGALVLWPIYEGFRVILWAVGSLAGDDDRTGEGSGEGRGSIGGSDEGTDRRAGLQYSDESMTDHEYGLDRDRESE